MQWVLDIPKSILVILGSKNTVSSHTLGATVMYITRIKKGRPTKKGRSGQSSMPLNKLRLFTESVDKEFIYIGANLILSFSNFA